MFLPIAALVISGTWLLGESRINAELSTLMTEERTYLDLSHSRLSDELTVPIRHMASISREAAILKALDPDADIRPMEEAFTSLVLRNPTYDKVRWIDETGMERVRINNRDGKPELVPKDKLQGKQDRYFFTEAMRLKAGEIYISPLDLNIDFGQIEVPYKPTIRVATRVFAPDGAPRGTLTINVAARSMLSSFVNSAGPAAGRLMLVNAEGYWLRSPDQRDEWGFMFNRKDTFGGRHPEVWKLISQQSRGQVKLSDGLWTWRSFSLPEDQNIPLSNQINWKVISYLPASKLSPLQQQVWPAKLLNSLIILIVFGVGIARLVQAKAARAQAEQDVALARSKADAAVRLQEAQAIFRMLFEANTSGLLVVDNHGHIIMANPAFEQMFGYTRQEVLDQPIELLIPQRYRSRHVEQRSAYIKQASARAMGGDRDLYGARKDGSEFPIEVGLSPYQENGLTFVLATIIDISERKRAQDEILRMNETLEHRVAERTAELQAARQEAEKLAAVKGNFLANMSHEIRTPMNAILGIAYLLEKADLGQDERNLVNKIRIAGRSLLGIINDILDFSKIESGRLEIEYAPFRLNDVLDNVATLMSANEVNDKVELVIGPSPAEVEFLRGDALRLEQVLINLTSNALKFTDRGDVTVTVTRIPPADDASVDRLRFSVKDTGIGIAPDKQVEIFNAFSQEDASTTRRFGGTGLGLSICRRLVELMGGEIGVISEPGKGSEFWFILPLEVTEQKNYITPDMTYQNVLIADDHPMARDSLAAMVRSLGWNCEVVSDGQEAVDRAIKRMQNNKSLDLLLLDWRMPGMNGLEAAQKIKAAMGDSPNSPIVVMATAHDRDILKQQPGAAIADVILGKPVTASALYNAVAEAKRHMQMQVIAHSAPRAESGDRLRQARILVVDDSEINLEVACRILEAEGAVVHKADQGQAALEWLRDHADQVDLVLMDVQMPLMDGYETTHHIRETLGLAELPVIALTAGAFKNQQAAALAAGMNGFIPKPFDVEKMIVLLQQYLAHGAWPAREHGPDDAPGTPETALAIDLPRGIRNWGDEAVYFKYLEKFAATHGQDGKEIRALIAHGEQQQAHALAHKLKGAAGNLALMMVSELADGIELTLSHHASTDDGPEKLQAALETTLQEIARITRSAAPAQAPAGSEAVDESTARKLLNDLLSALDHDNPDAAEPLLLALESTIPTDLLKPIHELVDGFDFRAAERQTRALIEQLYNKHGKV